MAVKLHSQAAVRDSSGGDSIARLDSWIGEAARLRGSEDWKGSPRTHSQPGCWYLPRETSAATLQADSQRLMAPSSRPLVSGSDKVETSTST